MNFIDGLILDELMKRELSEEEIKNINEYLFPEDIYWINEPGVIIFSPSAFAVKDRLSFLVEYWNKFSNKPKILIKNGRKDNYLEKESQERHIVEDVYSRDFPDRNFLDDYSKGEGWILKRSLIEDFNIPSENIFVSESVEILDSFLISNRKILLEEDVLLMPQPFGLREIERFKELIEDERYSLIKTPFKDKKWGDCSEKTWWKSPASKSLVLAELAITKKRLE